MGNSGLVELQGSHRRPLAGAKRVADAPAQEPILLTLVLRRRPDAQLPQVGKDVSRAVARERLADAAGADPQDIERVSAYLRDAGMEVIGTDPASRSMSVRTTVEAANQAFGVRLGSYEAPGVSYRGREGAVHLPPDVEQAVEAVLGLDDRPQARMHLKRGRDLSEDQLPDPLGEPMSLTPHAAVMPEPHPLWTRQVMRLYDFPSDLDGSDQTIAIIELGGGYQDAELATYFKRAKVHPAPVVSSVAVDRGANRPGGDADGEVLLDIEVAGTVAPRSTIVVYFADNSDRGFFDAINRAIHDTQHAPGAVSISWGGPESAWTPQAMRVFDAAMADAAALGVTVLAAAGDHGAGDAAGDGQVHADFPASSPHVVACGGTELVGRRGHIATELVWNEGDGWATGGGVSRQFPVPDYQQGLAIPANLDGSGGPGRGLPDVAGNASSRSGYIVRVDGSWTTVGGTSAVAPLYAGLVALLNQALERPLGRLLEELYAAVGTAGVFRDIEGGDNAVPQTSGFGPAVAGYPAVAGWDACTGLGSLNGTALLTHLEAASPAPATTA